MHRASQQPLPESSKKLANFRRTTARRVAEKQRVPVWKGYGPEPPTLRFGGGAAGVVAPTSAARALARRMLVLPAGARARRAGARAAPPGEAAASSSGPPQGSGTVFDLCEVRPNRVEVEYKRLPVARVAAAVVVVPSQWDLVLRTPSRDLLHAWLGIIALGCRVVSHRQPQGQNCGVAAELSRGCCV